MTDRGKARQRIFNDEGVPAYLGVHCATADETV